MKELTIEQKAKGYDEALEKAREWYVDSQIDFKKSLENLFPELAEESEDEKIRKAIIECVKNYGPSSANPKLFKNMLAWLEKQGEQYKEATYTHEVVTGNGNIKALVTEKVQLPKFKVGDKVKSIIDGFECTIESIDNTCYYGDTTNFDIQDQDGWELVEQKPADKVEPKFHEGEWITNGKCTWKIDSIDEDMYYNNHCGIDCGGDIKSIDEEYHLWSVQDAKDGDVLACNEEILLFKSYSVQGRISLYCWYNGHTNTFHSKEVDDTLLTTRYKIYPATIEQRDLLFSKMKDAGYEWDAEKKELKKIEQRLAWSEEDEKMLKDTIRFCELCGNQVSANWLKSLKNRYTWEPSDE